MNTQNYYTPNQIVGDSNLHQNIARLSAIVASGHFQDNQVIEDPNDSTQTIVTTKLTGYQMRMHIDALMDNLKELREILIY